MTTIAYANPFVPPEWIAAHGLAPEWIRVQSVDDDRSGAVRGVCSYVRSFIAAATTDKNASAVVITTTCDQMRQAAALVARDADRPVFVMNVPSTWQTDAAAKLYLGELRRLGRFLCSLGGRAPTADELAGVMFEYESARSSLVDARHRMSARQFAVAAAGCRSGVKPDGVSGGPSRPDQISLALLGGPLLEKDHAILDIIENSGGRVVLDASEGGERTFPRSFNRRSVREDPLSELADAYFGSIADAFRRPNDRLYDWLAGELSARQIRGVLFWRYVWCDVWHAELGRLCEWSPVPVLDVDVAQSDDGSLGRIATRIEAFLEMLK